MTVIRRFFSGTPLQGLFWLTRYEEYADVMRDLDEMAKSEEPKGDVYAKPVWIKCTVANVFEVNLQHQTFKALIKLEAQWWPLNEKDKERLDELLDKHGETKKDGEKCLPDEWLDDRNYSGKNAFTANEVFLSVPGQTLETPEQQPPVHGPRFSFTNCIEKAKDSEWFTISKYNNQSPLIKWNVIFVSCALFNCPPTLKHAFISVPVLRLHRRGLSKSPWSCSGFRWISSRSRSRCRQDGICRTKKIVCG